MAVNEEDFFRDFYRAAAGKVTISSAKELLLRLSAEEKVHKEKLQSYDFRRVSLKEGKPIQLAQPMMLTPIDEFARVKDIFAYAIKSESLARQRYAVLAESVDDDAARWLFNALSVEEKKHEKLLKDELKQMGI